MPLKLSERSTKEKRRERIHKYLTDRINIDPRRHGRRFVGTGGGDKCVSVPLTSKSGGDMSPRPPKSTPMSPRIDIYAIREIFVNAFPSLSLCRPLAQLQRH